MAHKRSYEIEKTLSATVFASTFRTLGDATTLQNLFTLSNGAGSSVLVVVRSLDLMMEATVGLNDILVQFKVFRTSDVPSAGTTLTKAIQDTVQASSSSVVAMGATASDGGAADSITATASGTAIVNVPAMKMRTAVGQVIGYIPINLMPLWYDQEGPEGIVLNADEAIVVQAIHPTNTSNPNTNHYIVNCAWDELI